MISKEWVPFALMLFVVYMMLAMDYAPWTAVDIHHRATTILQSASEGAASTEEQLPSTSKCMYPQLPLSHKSIEKYRTPKTYKTVDCPAFRYPLLLTLDEYGFLHFDDSVNRFNKSAIKCESRRLGGFMRGSINWSVSQMPQIKKFIVNFQKIQQNSLKGDNIRTGLNTRTMSPSTSTHRTISTTPNS